MEYEICLDSLSNCKLSDDLLIQLYEKKNLFEPLITLGKRLLINDCSTEKFLDFLSIYKIDLVYDLLLRYAIVIYINDKQSDLIYIKLRELIKLIILEITDKDLVKQAYTMNTFLNIIYENNLSILYNYYNETEELNLLALSINKEPPFDLLNKMSKIKKIKYSKVIRNKVRIRLKNVQN